MNSETRLFAYGTLKSGTPMHEQLCRDVRSVHPARLWGRLYELPPMGWPALALPKPAVLGLATMSPEIDHARLDAALAEPAPEFSNDGWHPIEGELITLGDYRTAWAPLDAWEDAVPDHPTGLRRVLVRVDVIGFRTTAWTYIVRDLPSGSRELCNGVWPVPIVEPASGE
jgi:gamma-glutamylcyclotransferase (GGCT)/AIG2-like uncharacterized protein YtfP